MAAIRLWLLALILVVLAVVISFYWADRPLALVIHDHLPHKTRSLTAPAIQVPNPLIWLATMTFVALGLRDFCGRPLSRLSAAALACSVSLMAAELIKNDLKFVFGRTWPESWIQSYPSFIRDGVYGFNWFHGGDAYHAFPSGHMTAVCAVATVFWIFYPRFRIIYVTSALLGLIALIALNFHFLSDAIAGAFVGVSIGVMATRLYTRSATNHMTPHVDGSLRSSFRRSAQTISARTSDGSLPIDSLSR
jgi:membrane-associated phospholipid phosphatase